MTETTSTVSQTPQGTDIANPAASGITPGITEPTSGAVETDAVGAAVADAPAGAAQFASAATEQVASAADGIAPVGSEITSAVIVDGTLWILIGFSVATWALILIKGIQHLRIAHHNRRFNKQFWGAPDFQAAAELGVYAGPAARVAQAGFTTLIEADGGTTTHDLEHTGDRQELLDRRLRQQMQKERGALESGLAILATVGSISPFVGLFGTVWGIMGALTSISKSGSASLDVVAGPIGEALIATAVGIAVAVPAVIAYNFFIRRNKVIWAFLDDFAIDFVHLALKTSFIIKRPSSRHVAAPRVNDVAGGRKYIIDDEALPAKGAHA
jgi:biopolymer transport protein ExbB